MPSFETPGPITVVVDLALGDLHVTASDRTDAVVTVEPTDPSRAGDRTAANDTKVTCVEGRLTVSAPGRAKRFSLFDKGGSVQVAIEVPNGSGLEVAASLGDVHVEGELGRCQIRTSMGAVRLDQATQLTLETGYGDVSVDRVEGDADITTGSGAVRVGVVAGAAIVRNANGATSIDAVSGDVRVKAANGGVTIARADRSVVARTAAGSIEVGELRRGVAVLETSAGDLSCGIAEGTAVRLDVHSKVGRIRSSLDAIDAPTSTDEVVELQARTTVGDITLHRSERRIPAG